MSVEPATPAPVDPSRGRDASGLVLVALALVASFLALVEPALARLALPGAVLALGGAWVLRKRGGLPVAVALVAVAWAAAARVETLFVADSPSYYVYLRSLAFDGDIDSANEWAHWGFPPRERTVTGLPFSAHPVGPALLWSPFFALAHLWVVFASAVGVARWPADGYSDPYVRSTAAGTLAVGVAGAVMLARALARRFDPTAARLAVLAVVFATPAVYYLLFSPSMAHGLEFGLAAVLLALLLREPRPWPAVGLVLGLLGCVRPQALVYSLLVAACAVSDLRGGRARPGRVALGAGLSLLAFAPQMLVWNALFGSPLAGPPAGTMDWRAPHLWQTLLSADRGLFVWTPLALPALAGLAIAARRVPLHALGGLAVCLATAWVNGSVLRFTGDRAFGARRYALVLPLLALGLCALAAFTARQVARRPVLVPVAVLVLAVAWNAGLLHMHLVRDLVRAAPLETTAAGQARRAYAVTDRALRAVAGDSGHALAYMMFVGEYLYQNVYPGGSMPMAAIEERHLTGAWSPLTVRSDGPRFRFALAPRACVVLPLPGDPAALRAALLARGVRSGSADVPVTLNGRLVRLVAGTPDWTETALDLGAPPLRSGPNELCLEGPGLPPGERLLAVAGVQLP